MLKYLRFDMSHKNCILDCLTICFKIELKFVEKQNKIFENIFKWRNSEFQMLIFFFSSCKL